MTPGRFAIALFGTVLMASGASAQIVVNNHATGAPLASPFILPDAPVNDSEQFQVDVVNTGSASVTVDSAVVFGEYYSLCCESAFTLAPAAVQTLTLTFSPQTAGYQSGSLQIDGQTILLFAQGVAAASLFVETAGGKVQAHVGSPLTFTATSSMATFILMNNGSSPVPVNSINVSGSWSVIGLPALPLTLQAGQQITFTLSATGTALDGSVSGLLSINQWAYRILAQPIQPAIAIQVSSPLKSAQQASIAIQFNPAPTAPVSGTLQLSFDSGTTFALTDPAILFTSSGTTSLPFTSVVGQSTASFGGASSATFQTGTTAGTIHITATWLNASVTSDVHITQEPIAIDSVTASREPSALDVTVSGYDNTRTAGVMSFSFFDAQGSYIGQAVSADFTQIFYNYFFDSAYSSGGMFKMTAHFPVTGDPRKVSSVKVDLMNSAGDAPSSVTPF